MKRHLLRPSRSWAAEPAAGRRSAGGHPRWFPRQPL